MSTPEPDARAEDEEVVDALPVPAVPAATPRQPPFSGLQVAPVAAQAAALAVGGFAAGAATVAVVRRRRTRKAVKARRKELGAVLASRSFLVDVHLLGGKG